MLQCRHCELQQGQKQDPVVLRDEGYIYIVQGKAQSESQDEVDKADMMCRQQIEATLHLA